jgi:membrane protease YdiL (CAAX protease family)
MVQKVGSRIGSVFVGPEGLRAGWRFLLFALGIELTEFFVRGPLLLFLSRRFELSLDELSAPALFLEELVGLVVVLLVTGIAALLERRRVDYYGLPVSRAFGWSFWKGMLAGLAVVAFVAGAMVVTGGMMVQGLALHGTSLLWFGLLWLGANVLVGLNEEYLFRGYALRALWRGAGFWPAALVTTAVFAGLHLSKPNENAMDIGMIFILGLALCLSVRRTGSLWWAVGWHAAFDFGQFFLIGTRNGGQMPVSHLFEVTFPGSAWLNGGELGTEASVFMVPAAIATFIYVGWFLVRRNRKVAVTDARHRG